MPCRAWSRHRRARTEASASSSSLRDLALNGAIDGHHQSRKRALRMRPRLHQPVAQRSGDLHLHAHAAAAAIADVEWMHPGQLRSMTDRKSVSLDLVPDQAPERLVATAD